MTIESTVGAILLVGFCFAVTIHALIRAFESERIRERYLRQLRKDTARRFVRVVRGSLH